MQPLAVDRDAGLTTWEQCHQTSGRNLHTISLDEIGTDVLPRAVILIDGIHVALPIVVHLISLARRQDTSSVGTLHYKRAIEGPESGPQQMLNGIAFEQTIQRYAASFLQTNNLLALQCY